MYSIIIIDVRTDLQAHVFVPPMYMKVYVPTPCPPPSKVPSQAQRVLSRLFLLATVGAASGSPTGHVASRIDAALGSVSDALGGVADGVSQAFGGIAENVAKSADWTTPSVLHEWTEEKCTAW